MDTHALDIFHRAQPIVLASGSEEIASTFSRDLAQVSAAIHAQVLSFVVFHHRRGNLIGNWRIPPVQGRYYMGPPLRGKAHSIFPRQGNWE